MRLRKVRLELDWERILGVEFFDRVYLADRIAGTVRTAGFVHWFAAVGLAVWAIVRSTRLERSADANAGARVTAEPRAPLAPVDDDQMWR
jgi:hypothetical protein